MPKLDLNKATDFAKLTTGGAASVLQQLTGLQKTQWDIQEGSYNGVLFHVFKTAVNYNAAVETITDTGGRRKVKYRFPYVDGQTTDDLGSKPEDFDINILLFGSRYLAAFNKLMAQFKKPTPGDLVHPVRGKITVTPEEWTITHSSDKRLAVALNVKFIEHNFTIGEISSKNDKSAKTALSAALAAFGLIDAVVAEVTGKVTLANTLKKLIAQGVVDFKAAFGKNLAAMNAAFNPGGSSVDIPTLLPTQSGGLLKPDGTLVSNAFPIVTSPSDPFAAVPISLSTTTSTAVLTVQAIQNTAALRATAEGLIAQLKKTLPDGTGALQFNQSILNLKTVSSLMLAVLERGLASSRARVVNYKTPRVMSIREIAYANGLELSRVNDIITLNPQIQSANFVDVGTTLKVPVGA